MNSHPDDFIPDDVESQFLSIDQVPDFVQGTNQRIQQLLEQKVEGMDFWKQLGVLNLEADGVWCPLCQTITQTPGRMANILADTGGNAFVGVFAVCEACQDIWATQASQQDAIIKRFAERYPKIRERLQQLNIPF